MTMRLPVANHRVLALSVLTLLPARPLLGQTTALQEPEVTVGFEFPLTIQSIMRGAELVGQAPTGVRWTDDGQWIYFRWLPGGQAWHEERDLYRVPATGGEPERLDDEAADSLAVHFSGGDVSADHAWRVTSVEGDLYLVERATGSVRRLTRTTEAESSPAFSGDDQQVFFRRNGNLYSLTRADGAVRQLTDVRSGPAPKDDEPAEGHKGFLEEQQRELFEHVRVAEERDERREADQDRREAERPEPLYLDSIERVQALAPDPTGAFVVATVTKPAQDATQTLVPRWVTTSGYTEDSQVRAKVGDEQSEARIALIDVETGGATWLDLTASDAEEGDEPAAEAEADEPGAVEGAGAAEGAGAGEGAGGAEATRQSGAKTPALAVARFAGWNDEGTHGLLFAVDFDYKAWRLYALEAATGELTLLDSHEDEAWVGGPCFPRFGGGCLGWFPDDAPVSADGPRAWYVSEETGYAHLYAIDVDGSDRRQLTSGEWEVQSVTIPEGRDRFLLHTSEVSPFDLHPWRMEFDGARRTQVLAGEGSYRTTPSPGGDRLAVLVSRSNRPPELFVSDNDIDSALDQVTVSPTAEWLTFPWIQPEIVRVEARDGTGVPARIYRPSDVGARANGAGVVFVHGAGYLHNVHNWWSSYYREYMFHHFLAANGYTVLDIDYRGSAGYGRDWRTAIYRHMGGWDLSDQVDGAGYLASAEGVDPGRIGIYGGSYGGFITLMALFTEPDVFAAGAALRSVTDWAHYNHWYTSRILNLPDGDEEAYRRSSPIYFADGLKGHLLIAHGMYDTNVHFSDVVRLAQRLIELGKENWEMAVYPVENHGFVEPTSWTDEYRRIFELFQRSIGTQAAGSADGE
jgi:dipeptidyl aminopeptidase/acylaminoacyl peptidase